MTGPKTMGISTHDDPCWKHGAQGCHKPAGHDGPHREEAGHPWMQFERDLLAALGLNSKSVVRLIVTMEVGRYPIVEVELKAPPLDQEAAAKVVSHRYSLVGIAESAEFAGPVT